MSGLRRFSETRGLSAIASVIIIVAIAIGLTIAVVLWTTGVIQSFFTVEKVELTAYSEFEEEPNAYKVIINIKNTGTRNTVIDGVYLNQRPFWDADVSRVSFYIEDVNQTLTMRFLLPIGKTARVEVYLGPSFRPNQLVEVELHTAAGNKIFATTTLP